MGVVADCLRCDTAFDWEEDACPDCGWNVAAFRERGRHGLAREGHGEPEESSGRDGPPPGPDGLHGV